MAALMPGMIYTLDLRSDRPGYVDDALARLIGLPPSGITLLNLRRRIHPADRVLVGRHFAHLFSLTDEGVSEVSFRVRGETDDWSWIRLRARVLSRDRSGRPRRIIGIAADITQSRAVEGALASTLRRLDRAETTERRRIGREMHDSTIQHLVAIDLLLGMLSRQDESSREATVAEIHQSLAAAQHELRTMAYILHPPSLEDQGLRAALRVFCEGFARRTELTIRLDAPPYEPSLPFDLELALFRIAQEALMNVHRHAQAREVTVRLQVRREVLLQIEDDGVGMGSTQLAAAIRGAGVGIAGIRTRLIQMGGALSLESNGNGLILTANAPLPVAEAAVARPSPGGGEHAVGV